MRLVVFKGVQYDADRLPAHVDASKAVPIDRWFAENRNPPRSAPDPVAEKPKKRRTRHRTD